MLHDILHKVRLQVLIKHSLARLSNTENLPDLMSTICVCLSVFQDVIRLHNQVFE